MSKISRQKLTNWFGMGLAFAWPFFYLFPYVFPIKGRYLQIGNDFYPLYYKYKVYLLSLLNSSHFPLWSPSEAAGFPFAASPFTQSFYPFNLPLAFFYHIAHGFTYLDYQRFTVLGISIFALGTYLWLRSLNIDWKPALFAALVMSTSFKVVELIRLPNAVHTACWYPWLLLALTKIVASPSSRQKVLYGILLVFSGFCLVTGGYPYFLYYSLFLIVPYCIFILFPALRRKLFNFQDDHPLQTWITLAVTGVLLLVISSPYLFQVLQLIKQATDRATVSFYFATVNLFSFEDTLGSLVYPPAAEAEGWYHFGFVGLFLILIFLFGRTGRKGQNIPVRDDSAIIKWVLLGWILLISYISYGKESILFAFLWRVLPGFSSLREWGKLSIILIPILAWLLALAYRYFMDIVISANGPSLSADPFIRTAITVLAGSMIVILGIQSYFTYFRVHDRYWTAYFLVDFSHLFPVPYQRSPWAPSLQQIHHFLIGLFILFGFLSFLACLFFLLRARALKPSPINAMLILFIVLSTLNTFIAGPWMWTSGWADLPHRAGLDILTADIESFNVPRTDTGYDTLSLNSTFNIGEIPSWYFNRYTVFRNSPMYQKLAAGNLLMTGANGQKIYFSSSITPLSIQAFFDDAGRFPQDARVNAYNGDFLDLSVNAPADGYISFIDNWDPNWRASVDGHLVALQLLFGTFKSVRISKGPHRVEMAYCPPVFEILNSSCSNIR